MSISQDVRHAAAGWHGIISDRSTAEERERFEAWRVQDPSHARAFACIEAMDEAVRGAIHTDPQWMALRQRALAARPPVFAVASPWLKMAAALAVVMVGSVAAWRVSHPVASPSPASQQRESEVFDNTSLRQAIAQICQHTGTPVVLGDPELAHLPVTGTFYISRGMDRRFIEALQHYYPIAAETHADGTITITLRPRGLRSGAPL